jgi:hypothetical protein
MQIRVAQSNLFARKELEGLGALRSNFEGDCRRIKEGIFFKIIAVRVSYLKGIHFRTAN